MGGTIFISYRRGQDAGFAGRLFDRLERTFRRKALFMDVDSITPGQDFVSILEAQVAECDILLALIGGGWLTATDEAGRRLDNPEDFVRIEIATALAQAKRVIPVLIDDVPMPRPEDLPKILRPLVHLAPMYHRPGRHGGLPPAGATLERWRILKPGGRMIFAVPVLAYREHMVTYYGRRASERDNRDSYHRNLMSESEWRRELGMRDSAVELVIHYQPDWHTFWCHFQISRAECVGPIHTRTRSQIVEHIQGSIHKFAPRVDFEHP